MVSSLSESFPACLSVFAVCHLNNCVWLTCLHQLGLLIPCSIVTVDWVVHMLSFITDFMAFLLKVLLLLIRIALVLTFNRISWLCDGDGGGWGHAHCFLEHGCALPVLVGSWSCVFFKLFPFFLFVSFPYLKLFSQAFLLKDGNLFCLLHVSYVWVEAKLKYSGWFDLSNYNYRLYFPHCESLRSTSLNSQKIYKIEEKNLMYKSHF